MIAVMQSFVAQSLEALRPPDRLWFLDTAVGLPLRWIIQLSWGEEQCLISTDGDVHCYGCLRRYPLSRDSALSDMLRSAGLTPTNPAMHECLFAHVFELISYKATVAPRSIAGAEQALCLLKERDWCTTSLPPYVSFGTSGHNARHENACREVCVGGGRKDGWLDGLG